MFDADIDIRYRPSPSERSLLHLSKITLTHSFTVMKNGENILKKKTLKRKIPLNIFYDICENDDELSIQCI